MAGTRRCGDGSLLQAGLVGHRLDSRGADPTLFALGCTAMAMGAAFHLWTFDAVTLFVSFNEAAAGAPVAGMTMGGVWFGLGALPRSPVPAAERVGHRIQLLFLVLVTIGGVGAASVLFAAVPAMAVGLCAGIACAGDLVAGSQMVQAFRPLCLPYQMAVALGSVLFVPITLFLAAWGIPELSPALQQTTLLVIASFPEAGFVREHRKRPGLPTMVIALLSRGQSGRCGEVIGSRFSRCWQMSITSNRRCADTSAVSRLVGAYPSGDGRGAWVPRGRDARGAAP